jgi:hypothetical protein
VKGGHHAHLESSAVAERIAKKFVRECLIASTTGGSSNNVLADAPKAKL